MGTSACYLTTKSMPTICWLVGLFLSPTACIIVGTVNPGPNCTDFVRLSLCSFGTICHIFNRHYYTVYRNHEGK